MLITRITIPIGLKTISVISKVEFSNMNPYSGNDTDLYCYNIKINKYEKARNIKRN